jgi:hypothetical protein
MTFGFLRSDITKEILVLKKTNFFDIAENGNIRLQMLEGRPYYEAHTQVVLVQREYQTVWTVGRSGLVIRGQQPCLGGEKTLHMLRMEVGAVVVLALVLDV